MHAFTAGSHLLEIGAKYPATAPLITGIAQTARRDAFRANAKPFRQAARLHGIRFSRRTACRAGSRPLATTHRQD